MNHTARGLAIGLTVAAGIVAVLTMFVSAALVMWQPALLGAICCVALVIAALFVAHVTMADAVKA